VYIEDSIFVYVYVFVCVRTSVCVPDRCIPIACVFVFASVILCGAASDRILAYTPQYSYTHYYTPFTCMYETV
jgi:hypothetical protein